ncbi:hypothetical protein [Spiroplasma ixodetis]|uniref:Uncharacterized protein n=1 Tax=Spiroplasma ixodetis TaxID=2141 RepID=A0ABN6T4Y8_9MOLU|nr:hypothetical protein [Spiroplasma ixodetis]BDT05216.1 hypothetical protein SHM_28620 [Spiroplasma ixodetis]
MKKFNTYGTFGCINQILHTDKNGKVTTENVSALKFLEHRNKKSLVLTAEQIKQLKWQRQVARMKRQCEETVKWMKEFNSWSLEKRYEYWQKAYDDRKKANIKVSKKDEQDLQEMKKRVELEKKMRKIKTHVFAIDKWNQATTDQINSEVQETIKEAKYKLDCEKKNIEYHPIQHV